MLGNARRVRARDLDVPAEDARVTQLERSDAGVFAELGLELDHALGAALGERGELVEVGVVAGAEDGAVLRLLRRALDERVRELTREIRDRVQRVREPQRLL